MKLPQHFRTALFGLNRYDVWQYLNHMQRSYANQLAAILDVEDSLQRTHELEKAISELPKLADLGGQVESREAQQDEIRSEKLRALDDELVEIKSRLQKIMGELSTL